MTYLHRTSILIVAGEASGDLHGGELAREILKRDPTMHIYGVGSVEMERAGVHLVARSSDIAATGFFEIFSKLRKIWSTFKILVHSVDIYHPKVIILIDCPDFNLRLAKRLHRRAIPIVYYIGPHVWIWRQHRVQLIKKWISKMLVVFPFEENFYRALGVDAKFVGHPLIDRVKPKYGYSYAKRHFGLEEGKKTIVLMPGSRSNEVKCLLKPILEAADKIYSENSQVQFLLPLASTIDDAEVNHFLKELRVPLKVVRENIYDVMAAGDLIIGCSGTATLEAAILGKPMVVVFRVYRLTYFLGMLFFGGETQFFALPNLLAARKIVPELIQSDVTPSNIAREAFRYLKDPGLLIRTSEELLAIKSKLEPGGASGKVADEVFHFLTDKNIKGVYPEQSKVFFVGIAQRAFYPLLWMGSKIYRFVITFRQYLYLLKIRKAEKVPAKVVSVGNITMGGTGKTPLTIHLTRELRKRGRRVAILSRGYKRKGKKAWDCVSDGHSIRLSVKEAGDEPLLMAQKLQQVPIYVGKKRYQFASKVVKEQNTDVLLLDDGFQHWRLDRDFDFVTVDVTSFNKRSDLFPLGSFREPLSHLKRANCIVLTRTDHISDLEKERIKRQLCTIRPNIPIIEANYQVIGLKHLASGENLSLDVCRGKKIFAFAGIGNPHSFRRMIERVGGNIVGFKTFLDHFPYSEKHIQRILRQAKEKGADLILTTEKDEVRVPLKSNVQDWNKVPLYSLVVDMEVTKGKAIFENILNSL